MTTRDPQLRERRPRPWYHRELPVGLRQAASAGQPASRASTREGVPVASTPSSTSAGQHGYLLDNQAEQAGQRFAALAALYDPITIGHLDALGVGAGWRCLEVGAGGGSIVRWLAERIGATGSVLATDLDTRWLAQQPPLPTVQIRQHNIVHDPLDTDAFDLVHERLVLLHLPARAEVLSRLVGALKPGGWLLVEDFDSELVPDRHADADSDGHAVELMNTFRRGIRALLRARGADPQLGRSLPRLLRDAGLEQVGADGYLPITLGSATRDLHTANITQVRDDLAAAGLMRSEQLDRLLRTLAEASLTPAAPLLVSAWGRRPAAPLPPSPASGSP
jgi:SAM-dependent methyltransferase